MNNSSSGGGGNTKSYTPNIRDGKGLIISKAIYMVLRYLGVVIYGG
ncbi:hypothetical protein FHR99_003194 [Litorivivens lipolytica]|uniref:Uncharacterized protein n=1 Tax=Litorivivens lipolytica TaxID=1524264 RepID=A0A7W4Z8E0_9GAMM|nr:hypothetical protein [Litorivivens lipolytica]